MNPIILLALMPFTLPASAQTVVDGDTIKLEGMIYRLGNEHVACGSGSLRKYRGGQSCGSCSTT